jgi:hypothetical protein
MYDLFFYVLYIIVDPTGPGMPYATESTSVSKTRYNDAGRLAEIRHRPGKIRVTRGNDLGAKAIFPAEREPGANRTRPYTTRAIPQ